MKVPANISALNFPSRILAVEYTFSFEGDEMYACQLKINGREINLERTKSSPTPEELFSEKETKTPVLLMFTGKKVLSKRIDYTSTVSDEELAARAFPGVQRDDLIFQIHPLKGSEYSVSAIRRDVVVEVLEGFQKLGVDVLDIALSTYSLWPLLKTSVLSTSKLGNYEIDVDSSEIHTSDTIDEEVELFGQTIQAEFTGSFLYGLQTMADKEFQSDFDPLVAGRKEWKYGILYKKGIVIAASSFFTLLLISFILFTHYQSKNAELGQLAQAYDQQYREVSALKNVFEEKNQFLKINGGRNSIVGQMGDQLALLLPGQITLSEMKFQPVTRRLKRENLVRFSRNELQVAGTTDNYESFQEWLNRIRELTWVDDMEITGYQETNSRHRANFSIKIVLTE